MRHVRCDAPTLPACCTLPAMLQAVQSAAVLCAAPHKCVRVAPCAAMLAPHFALAAAALPATPATRADACSPARLCVAPTSAALARPVREAACAVMRGQPSATMAAVSDMGPAAGGGHMSQPSTTSSEWCSLAPGQSVLLQVVCRISSTPYNTASTKCCTIGAPTQYNNTHLPTLLVHNFVCRCPGQHLREQPVRADWQHCLRHRGVPRQPVLWQPHHQHVLPEYQPGGSCRHKGTERAMLPQPATARPDLLDSI